MTEKKWQFINTFWLKLLAIVVMTVDHFAVATGIVYIEEKEVYYLSGFMTIENYELLREIGRIAFPIFCYSIVEGFFYTKDVLKYSLRLLVFAFISQVPFSLVLYGKPFLKGGDINVYFTLFLGLVAITFLDYYCNQFKNEEIPGISTLAPGIIIAFLAAALGEFLHTDYGALGVMFIILFYIFRRKPVLIGIGLFVLIWFFSSKTELYALIALIPILLHNGKKGPGLKYFFYLYYPLHLTALYLLNQFVI